MPSNKLTTRTAKSARYKGDGSSRFVVWDTELKGFGLRIYPSGKKAFVVSYRAPQDGRKRLKRIGAFGTFTPEQARDDAQDALRMVRKGKDPIEEEHKAAQGETFADLTDAFMERHAKPNKLTWKADESRFRRHVPLSWKQRKVKSIKRAEVATLHHKIGKNEGPYEANRFLDLLKKAFNLAKIWGFLEEVDPNPATGIDKFKEVSRQRYAKPDELPLLAAAIDEEENIYVRAAVWLYILTGTRRSELLGAKHTQIDWAARRLLLPKTKAGEAQSVALSDPAIAILQGIPKQENNPYIFAGSKPKKPLVNISKPWIKIRKRATVKAWAKDSHAQKLIKRLEKKIDKLWTETKLKEFKRPPTIEEITAQAKKKTSRSQAVCLIFVCTT